MMEVVWPPPLVKGIVVNTAPAAGLLVVVMAVEEEDVFFVELGDAWADDVALTVLLLGWPCGAAGSWVGCGCGPPVGGGPLAALPVKRGAQPGRTCQPRPPGKSPSPFLQTLGTLHLGSQRSPTHNHRGMGLPSGPLTSWLL